MEPPLTIVGEALGQALEKDRPLPQRMQTALSSAVKDQIQELASENVIRTEKGRTKQGVLS